MTSGRPYQLKQLHEHDRVVQQLGQDIEQQQGENEQLQADHDQVVAQVQQIGQQLQGQRVHVD